ncbi:DUF4954 family protein, partial [Brachyspira pilosicoli]|nr:DUF4954 family protein [Brachyspira pilosicoli]
VILNIENNNINNVQDLVKSFEKLYNNYSTDEKSWVINIIKKRYNVNTINIDVIIKMLKEHLSLLTTSYEIFYRDVKKEYDLAKMVSCGIDDKTVMEEDFKAIRGTAKDNAFVIKYKNDVETKIEDINKLIKKLGN